MPTKIIQPVDSIVSIAATVLQILHQRSYTVDDLWEEVNKEYYKQISIDKLLLSIDFLFIINKVRSDNEIIAINLR